MNKATLGGIVVVCAVAVFLLGFACGNFKGAQKGVGGQLGTVEELLKSQDRELQQINSSLKVLAIGGAPGQISPIWLPSILVILNIILVMFYANRKKPSQHHRK